LRFCLSRQNKLIISKHMKKIYIVGAGFSGAVLARELAEKLGWYSVVIDSREHVAGNCHTEREESTGVMVHRYGPHIFHTSRDDVWEYVQKFGEFRSFVNRVKISIDKGVFSMPINLHTINQFYGTRMDPTEAEAFLKSIGDDSIETPANFEEQAMKFLGKELYEAFFKGYTKKQWGCDPTELPASILKRLPVRFNYDDNYYNSKHQGMPVNGYSDVISNILDHPLIEVRLGTKWNPKQAEEYDHVFYTGAIDEYFNHEEGRLGYRTVYWDRTEAAGDYQGNAVINYPGEDVPYTRIHEHKHFAPWESHEKTAVFTEYSKETVAGDIPYYPKRMESDMLIFEKYKERAENTPNVSFLGRLATYRYMDMHQVIGETLDYADQIIEAKNAGVALPTFSGI